MPVITRQLTQFSASFSVPTPCSVLALAALIVWLLCSSQQANAVIDTYQFDNEVTRQRYLHFVEEMRCPKCQNQNLAGSDSQIAADLRRELYLQLMAGKSDKEITDFMVARYGDFVLYRPQVKSNTYLLWGLPAALLLIGLLILWLTLRARSAKRAAAEEAGPLNHEQQTELDQLLQKAALRRTLTGDETDDHSTPR